MMQKLCYTDIWGRRYNWRKLTVVQLMGYAKPVRFRVFRRKFRVPQQAQHCASLMIMNSIMEKNDYKF